MNFDIADLLKKVPRVGESLAAVYGWNPKYFNFALVGFIGVLWQYILTWLFIGVGLPWFIAMATGIFAAFNSNFILNDRWVFKEVIEKDGLRKKKSHLQK